MDNKVRYIVEDLLPLYNDGLLSEETTEWFEQQVAANEELKALFVTSQKALPKKEIESPTDHDKMFKKINRKLSVYQIIFVAISFFLAVNTSLLNESFGFILWYAVLGFVTYVFYKDMKTVFLIAFIPVFIWSLGTYVAEYTSPDVQDRFTLFEYVLDALFGSFLLTFIHFAFAVVGSVIGWLTLKLKERG